jgi:MoxR-like ATPase
MAESGLGFVLDQADFDERLSRLERNVAVRVVVRGQTLRHVLLGLFAGGHVLLEDTPGVGKTLLSKTLAQSIDGRFSRIQFTPDLLPSDVTGSSIYNMREGRFEFVPGPVFTNILLADEINRTSPRTQSALLEAMAEGQVSADGIVHTLPRPFLVIATQNSSESHGIFPLPDSQLDRFMVSMSLGLPTAEDEVEILSREEHGAAEVTPVLSADDVLAMQDVVMRVNVALPVKEYVVAICRGTREHPLIRRGVSPRGAVMLQRAGQGLAAFSGRTFLTPDDVKQAASLVLPHRIALRPGSNVPASEVIVEILSSVPVPL